MGQHTLGICDRCGWAYKLIELTEEVKDKNPTNIFTCPTCFDLDHPQYEVSRLRLDPDPAPLLIAKPDIGEAQSRSLSRFNPVYGLEVIVEIGSVTIGS